MLIWHVPLFFCAPAALPPCRPAATSPTFPPRSSYVFLHVSYRDTDTCCLIKDFDWE